MQTDRTQRQSGEEGGDVWAAVCRPAFVAAVALLLINDHVLKTTAAVPGWLTGKLSDVAGLFFFPVLLAICAASCLRVRDDERIRAYSRRAAVATAAVFAALNLSPALAERVAEIWGTFTADWTDLVAVPCVFLGHRWFVRTLRAPERRPPRRFARAAMVVIAAGASIATSYDTPPAPATVENEKDPSLEFVDSSAEIFYDRENKGVFRVRIDGKQKVQLGPQGYHFWSSSISGETVLLRDGDKMRLYREGEPDQEKFPDFSGDLDRRLVSPGGGSITFGTSNYHSSDHTESYKLHLLRTDTMEMETIRSGDRVEEAPAIIGWEMDGSRLYTRTFGDDTARAYSVETEEWSEISPDDFERSELHGTRYEGERCRDENGVVELVEPFGEGNPKEFEGLELVRADGTSELLVEMELGDEVDDLDDYSSPLTNYFFLGGCDYVVFGLSTDSAIRVVGVDSKKVGTIAKGSFSAVPAFHVDTP